MSQQMRRSRIPIRRAAGCGVTLHRLPTSPLSNSLIHSTQARIYAPEHEVLGNPQGEAHNPQHAPACVIHRATGP